jgi:hypothetical protein
MRFEKDSPLNELIRTAPYIAFEFDSLKYERAGRHFNSITKPDTPIRWSQDWMIEHNGAPV